ncbi:MAG: ribonuclease III [Lachnospiraceae bacterium]|nr:ribonuclease III [Lachnospiraceae bacterium]
MEGKDILEEVKDQFELKGGAPGQYSPLTLAFIGDSVFDAVVKTMIVLKGNCPVNVLHRRASSIVKAASQARMLDEIFESLSDEEKSIYRRGKNAKPYTKAKNVTYAVYCKATGLEALTGYLYLCGRTERLTELIKAGIDALTQSEKSPTSKFP